MGVSPDARSLCTLKRWIGRRVVGFGEFLKFETLFLGRCTFK